MPWPPTLPSTADVSNTTLQANRHPGDHNLIADALPLMVTRQDQQLMGVVRGTNTVNAAQSGWGVALTQALTIPAPGFLICGGTIEWWPTSAGGGGTNIALTWDGTTMVIFVLSTSTTNGWHTVTGIGDGLAVAAGNHTLGFSFGMNTASACAASNRSMWWHYIPVGSN